MNIVFFNPYYIQPDKLPEIIDILKINEVYNLLPYGDFAKTISSYCGSKLVIKRFEDESLDDAKKRAVYKLVEHISSPVIVQGKWTGDCIVQDIYKNSNARFFSRNLALDDPNALILMLGRNQSEEIAQSTTKIMPYFFNIIKKYSKIDYRARICCENLSAFISLEYSEHPVNFSNHPNEVILNYFREQNFNRIAAHFLTDAGIAERERLIEIENEETRERWSQQEDDSGWQSCLNDELNYIRNNGGDWIDD